MLRHLNLMKAKLCQFFLGFIIPCVGNRVQIRNLKLLKVKGGAGLGIQ